MMHDSIDKTIGANIRLLRKENRLTQKALAEKLGLTFQQIQKYEKATNKISAAKLARLASIFNVDIDVFFQKDSAQETSHTDHDATKELVEYVQKMPPETRKSFMQLILAVAQKNQTKLPNYQPRRA